MVNFQLNNSIMYRNESSGEYLAPEVKVNEVNVRQSILQVSGRLSVSGNPFSSNEEDEW